MHEVLGNISNIPISMLKFLFVSLNLQPGDEWDSNDLMIE